MLGNIFRGNILTGIGVGIGAALLAPTIGPMLRPAAKAVIKSGILAFQGLVELSEIASDLAAEAQAELEPQHKDERSQPQA